MAFQNYLVYSTKMHLTENFTYKEGKFVTVNNQSAYKKSYKEHIKGTKKSKKIKMKKIK